MILITGATGFIGRQLVASLVSQGERPRCLVRNVQQASNILPIDDIELVQGTTTQPSTLIDAVRGVDSIVHAALMTADRKQSVGNHYEETNVGGTSNLILAARAAGVTRIVEISGLGTKPDKPGSYMQGRYLSEKMLIESGLAWTIIRPSILFGKGSPFVNGLADLIKRSPVLPLLGGGKLRFQPIFVGDVVTVITKVLSDPERANGKVFTIGGPEYYTFSHILDLLLQTMHTFRPKVYAPMPLVGIGAAIMEVILPKPPLTKAAMTLFSFDNITDLNSVQRDFGFQPRSFKSYLETEGI